jgi:hypothetical protein
VKAILDSWVRHEAAVREAEQKEMAASIIAKVKSQLSDPKIVRDFFLSLLSFILIFWGKLAYNSKLAFSLIVSRTLKRLHPNKHKFQKE